MKQFLYILSLFSLAACGGKSDQPATESDSLVLVNSWQARLDDSIPSKMIFEQTGNPLPDTISIPSVLQWLNSEYPQVQAQVDHQSADTLFVNIPEATYLTQQMGSTGPEIYFGEAVYNLTEIPGVRYVHFHFTEGDHASPDTYTRESFIDKKTP